MKKVWVIVLIALLPLSSFAQDYTVFTQTIKRLYASLNPDEAESILKQLTDQHQIPFTQNDSVAFIYSGKANTVAWMGDFNGWGYDKSFINKGRKIPNADIWILKASFPKDARFDYKIVVDDTNWMLDPLNTNQQWSGVGGGSPNSELRMPGWKEDPMSIADIKIPKGNINKDILMNSKSLGYQLTYSVYLPVNYNPAQQYPVIYVTDGYEYMHERMGNMITVLDNLIYLKKIKPVIAVFIDHREPVNRSNNRRMQELAMNEKYFSFVTSELIPQVEKEFKTPIAPADRAIIGTSMGGLTAAYFAFSKPQYFGLAGIQSPAFWFKPDIYTLCDNPENPPVKIYMTTGTINDARDGAQKMKSILDKNTCSYQYAEVSQGHSWGNWRDLIDDILIYFFPLK